MEKQTAVRETLLKEFANCSDKLFTLGIIRTDSFTGEIGEFIASKYLNSNHREVNRQYYPTEQLRQSNAIKKNDSTHKA